MAREDCTITSGRVYSLKIPTDFPESDGTAVWDSTTVVIVELSNGEHTGLGYTYCDVSAAYIAEFLIREVVSGKGAFSIPAIHLDLERKVRNMGRPGVASCAISAIDTALWDVKGK